METTLAIAGEGIEIHGVDNSAPMLATLQESLTREKPEIRDRVSLHAADMRDFRLSRRFPLVTIPFPRMQHMYRVGDQVRALTSAAAHLQGDGLLAFDVFHPKFERLPPTSARSNARPNGLPSLARRFAVSSATTGSTRSSRGFPITFLFRVYRDGQLTGEEQETLSMA